jgi:hypothetical protein
MTDSYDHWSKVSEQIRYAITEMYINDIWTAAINALHISSSSNISQRKENHIEVKFSIKQRAGKFLLGNNTE